MENINEVIPNEGVELEVAIPEVTEEAIESTEPITEPVVEEIKPIPLEDNISKIVAKKLSKDRQNLEKEVEAKYEKHRKLIERGAKENGMTIDEYLASFEEDASEQEQPDSRIAPEYKEILDEMVESKKTDKAAEEVKAYWIKQAAVLAKEGLKDVNDLPQEVWDNADTNGTDIGTEYRIWKAEQKFKLAEQSAIKKIQEQVTPGSLSGSLGVEDSKINSLAYDSDEFEEMIQKAKRGQLR